jgi:dipeptidase D
MNSIEKLSPSVIWHYFNEILAIPRPSKKEEHISEYLKAFAQKHNLPCKTDEAGNILITKPASSGYENRKSIVLQCHTDMVCEKNAGIKHNFETDPIKAYVDGDWVKAHGTTLGADDGIGIATALAVLASNTLKHGPLSCLFTVDEETGLSGAFALQPGFFEAQTLINLDSEDEGQIFIGCAGGIETTAIFEVEKENIEGYQFFMLGVNGLKGGHSGDDINKGLANANKLLVRLLLSAVEKAQIRIVYIDGGNLHNAIPREAIAHIAVKPELVEILANDVKLLSKVLKSEFASTEPGIKISLVQAQAASQVWTIPFQANILNALQACPNGVIAMSRTIDNLVETSTNLASIKHKNDTVIVTTSQRSSYDPSKFDIANQVSIVFRMAGATIKQSPGYPGWTPNPNSPVLETSKNVYNQLFNAEPEVKAIHAGLECGLFLEKYPALDMISIGPTMRGVHSPDERLFIPSVDKFWILLIGILEQH